jgi:hypothetical protein
LVGVISLVVATNLIERALIAIRCGKVLGMTRRDLPLFKDLGKLACAAVCAAIAVVVVRSLIVESVPPFLALSICGASFGLVYLAAILLLGVLSPDERDRLTRALLYLQRRAHGRRAANDVV